MRVFDVHLRRECWDMADCVQTLMGPAAASA